MDEHHPYIFLKSLHEYLIILSVSTFLILIDLDNIYLCHMVSSLYLEFVMCDQDFVSRALRPLRGFLDSTKSVTY